MKCVLVDIKVSRIQLKVHIDTDKPKINISNDTNISSISVQKQDFNVQINALPSTTKAHFSISPIKVHCTKIGNTLKSTVSTNVFNTKITTYSSFTATIIAQNPIKINILNKSFNINLTVLKRCIIDSIIIQFPYIFINYLGDTVDVEVKSTTTWRIE